MKPLIVAIITALLLSATADAQIWIMSPAGGGPTPTGAGGHGGGAPTTPCNAGQFDWSVATGCNLVFFR